VWIQKKNHICVFFFRLTMKLGGNLPQFHKHRLFLIASFAFPLSPLLRIVICQRGKIIIITLPKKIHFCKSANLLSFFELGSSAFPSDLVLWKLAVLLLRGFGLLNKYQCNFSGFE